MGLNYFSLSKVKSITIRLALSDIPNTAKPVEAGPGFS